MAVNDIISFMNVGIDTFGCDHGRSGLGSYLHSLVEVLECSSEITFELFGSEMDRYTYTEENPLQFTSVNIQDNLFSELFYHRFKVNSFARRQKYDAVVYASGARMIPPKFKLPSVVIVNDVVSAVLKNSQSSWQKRQIKRGLKNADCVVVPSNFVKEDLLECGIKCRRIEVVYSGVNHGLFYPEENIGNDESVVDVKPFAIKKPYIIYASSMKSPEKKHVELIQAFTKFKEKTALPHRLVIAGNEGDCSTEIHKAAFVSSAASDIFITGYFPHQEFPQLYRGAEACIFPSVNEGACLPILEAMSTGLPVACSTGGALKEVASDSALYFDSSDTDDIARAIESIVTDSSLRQTLIRKGLEQASSFTWQKSAGEIVSILKSICR